VRVRQKSDSETDRQTQRRIVQKHFSRRFDDCTSQIRSSLKFDLLHDANTSVVLPVQKVFSDSGRARRLRLVRKYIGHRIAERPELDNTF